MKQIVPNTEPTVDSGSSISKREKSSTSIIVAMNFFGKRSFTCTVRTIALAMFLCAVSRVSYSQNCSTSGTFNQSASENTYYPGTQATVNVGATSITLGAVPAGYGAITDTIKAGDLVLIIQMQGAQATYPATQTSSTYGS